MSFPVVTIKGNPPKIKNETVFRFLGYGKNKPDEKTSELIFQAVEKILEVSDFKACITEAFVDISDDFVKFPTFVAESKSLRRNLFGCKKAVMFTATIGVEADRLIQKASVTSQTRCVILNAAGSAAIEAWCEKINEMLKAQYRKKGKFLRPRFSPGYGDFNIKYQQEILALCQSYRKIGVCLTDSLMMLPVKSVSAVIGISDEENKLCTCKCDFCSQKNCIYGMR